MDVSVISPFQCKMTAADEKCTSERVRQYSLMKKSFAQQTQVTRQVVFEYSLLACEFFFYSLAIQGCPCSLYGKNKDWTNPRRAAVRRLRMLSQHLR